MEEAQKYALFESNILYDAEQKYENELIKIKQKATEEIKNKLSGDFGYVNYLISEYKTDRWFRRDAFIQLHENLNNAIKVAVRCLYYLNNSYAPAEDRSMYYSLSLQKLPCDYEKIIAKVCNQNTESKEDYLAREKLFKETIVCFIEKFL